MDLMNKENLANKTSLNESRKEDDKGKMKSNSYRERTYEFYITNLVTYSDKEKIRQKFSELGEIKDFWIKKSTNSRYLLAYIKLRGFIKHDWIISLKKKEDRGKPKRHICGRKNISRSRSHSKRRREKSHSSSKNSNRSYMKTDSKIATKKVREIFVGNLPYSIIEQDICNIFFVHGEIERIDLFIDRRYALVKFFLCSAAAKAVQMENNSLFRGNSLIVDFSDIKRKEIVEDKQGYEPREENCKIIHLNFPDNCKLPAESSIKEFFTKFGKLKGWNISRDPPNIFIYFDKAESAQEARKRLINSETGDLKKLIGDSKCFVNSHFKENLLKEKPLKEDVNNSCLNGSNVMMNFEGTSNSSYGNTLNNFNMAGLTNLMNFTNPTQDIKGNTSLESLYLQQLSSGTGIPINLLPGLNTASMNQPNGLVDSLNTLKLMQYIQASQKVNTPNGNSMPLITGGDNSISPMILNMYTIQNNPLNKQFNPNAVMNNLPYYMSQNPNQSMQSNISSNMAMSKPQFGMYPTADYNSAFMPYISQNVASNNVMPVPVQPMHENNNITLMKQMKSFSETDSSDNNIQGKVSSPTPPTNMTSKDISLFESEYSLEGENLKIVWSGDLLKNNKDRVSVVAYQLRNNCYDFLNNDLNLNVEHRTVFEDVLKRPHKGMVVFSPLSDSHCSTFDDYIAYFNQRQRVGIAYLKNNVNIVYIIAPSEFSKKFYHSPKKHLLGIFVDKKIAAGDATLTLPPPIISLTEKKKLMSQQKNNKPESNKKN